MLDWWWHPCGPSKREKRTGHLRYEAPDYGHHVKWVTKSEEVEPSSLLGRTWLGVDRIWVFSNWLGYQMLIGNQHGDQDLRTRHKASCVDWNQVKVTGRLLPDPHSGLCGEHESWQQKMDVSPHQWVRQSCWTQLTMAKNWARLSLQGTRC